MSVTRFPVSRLLFAAYGLLLSPPAAVMAESEAGSGSFVEAGYLNVDSSRRVSSFTLDGEESGWWLGGGYAFNRYLSVQAGYHNLGEGHFATDCPPPLVCVIQNLERVDIEGVSVALLGNWPVTRVVDVYGKLGLMSWDTDFQSNALNESDEDLLFGIGVGLNLSPNWRLSLQYEEVDFDLESAGLGLRYRF